MPQWAAEFEFLGLRSAQRIIKPSGSVWAMCKVYVLGVGRVRLFLPFVDDVNLLCLWKINAK